MGSMNVPSEARPVSAEQDFVHSWLMVRDEENAQASAMEEKMRKQLEAERERYDELQNHRSTVIGAFDSAISACELRINALQAAVSQYPDRIKEVPMSEPPINSRR